MVRVCVFARRLELLKMNSRGRICRCVFCYVVSCFVFLMIWVRCGVGRYVTVWSGTLRYGVVRNGTERCVAARSGMLGYVTVRCVTVRYGTLHGPLRYVTSRYGAARYVTVLYGGALYILRSVWLAFRVEKRFLWQYVYLIIVGWRGAPKIIAEARTIIVNCCCGHSVEGRRAVRGLIVVADCGFAIIRYIPDSKNS